MSDEPEPMPPLLKAELAHVQFEAIHPFPDGHGRLERLLIVLQFVADDVLWEPMLTSRKRGRVFSYRRYVEILGSEMEPTP